MAATASAITLNQRIPDYWADGYSDTWYYAGRPHIVNEVEWKADDPVGYADAVWV